MGEVQQTDKKPTRWRGAVGWILFALGAAERIIGWGGSLDFLISRSEDPGWVGDVLTFAATNTGYLSFVMMLAGVAFVLWNERRRTERLLEARLNSNVAAPTGTETWTRPPPETKPTLPETKPTPPEEDRIWLGDNISPIFLVEQHENKTSIEANDITGKYVGHWMKVGGFVRDIVRLSDQHLLVVLSTHSHFRGIGDATGG